MPRAWLLSVMGLRVPCEEPYVHYSAGVISISFISSNFEKFQLRFFKDVHYLQRGLGLDPAEILLAHPRENLEHWEPYYDFNHDK